MKEFMSFEPADKDSTEDPTFALWPKNGSQAEIAQATTKVRVEKRRIIYQGHIGLWTTIRAPTDRSSLLR